MTSEFPQDGGLVCCCYDYRVDVRLQNWVIGCIKSDACQAEREYP